MMLSCINYTSGASSFAYKYLTLPIYCDNIRICSNNIATIANNLKVTNGHHDDDYITKKNVTFKRKFIQTKILMSF